jgi:hypothetical protein
MHRLARLLERLVPALLLAGGATLLAAGLLSLAPSPSLGDAPTPSATGSAGNPALTPGLEPSALDPTPLPTAVPSFEPYLPVASPPTQTGRPSAPSAEPSPPAATPSASAEIYATRVVIPSLRIDLAVVPGDLDVRGNRNSYPLCDVAQYMVELVQPGQEGPAYIYAHAQRGMFLPMLRASTRNDGQEMIGALVEVYTSDSSLHLYEIYRVKRHATDLSLALDIEPGEHHLVLQTSEGPEGVIPKLQVAARPIGVVPSTPEEALPEAVPRACPPR